ncbi:MAG: DUF4912 domain-containing protein [Planctomycetota bacterium]
MIKTAELKAQTRRELADMAKNYGIAGWHGMKKDELIDSIRKLQRRLRRKANEEAKADSKPAPKAHSKRLAKNSGSTKARTTQRRIAKPSDLEAKRVSAKSARIRAQLRKRQETISRNKDLSTSVLVGGAAVQQGSERTRAKGAHRDRCVLLVRDSYWLQASWEITRASVQRAQSALAERWHTAVPVLRLMTVGDSAANGAESVARDIRIHSGVNTWYIDVDEPPTRFRVVVGYLSDNGTFHAICRSNIVETPRPGECDRLDEHWTDIAEDYERIYSQSGGYDTSGGDLKEMFEERLRRSMPQRGEKSKAVADPEWLRKTKLPFNVDAELIVFGQTSPGASVMVAGNPVKLQGDGSFTLRMELPDKRQVLPVTAESRDGLRQRTTVIAVERNTKVMEPVEHEDNF